MEKVFDLINLVKIAGDEKERLNIETGIVDTIKALFHQIRLQKKLTDSFTFFDELQQIQFENKRK